MATKDGALNRSEKLEIEKLIKCRRERKRVHVLEKLDKARKKIEASFNSEIEELEKQILDIKNKRDEAVRDAGYGKIHDRGCYDTHPDLDAFDEETNGELQELWE